MDQEAGLMINGFQATVTLSIWTGLVLIHGLFWRSLRKPAPDPVRPSGPTR